MNKERVVLTREQATAMLPDGDTIHAYMNPKENVLVGADWDRKKVEQTLADYRVELSGEIATSMGHGIVAFTELGHIFFQTKTTE